MQLAIKQNNAARRNAQLLAKIATIRSYRLQIISLLNSHSENHTNTIGPNTLPKLLNTSPSAIMVDRQCGLLTSITIERIQGPGKAKIVASENMKKAKKTQRRMKLSTLTLNRTKMNGMTKASQKPKPIGR